MITSEMLLRLEMQELQDRYVAAIDEDRLEDWPKFFVEDCLYEIIPNENVEAGFPIAVLRCDCAAMLRDRVISLRHANIYAKPSYRHFISGLSCRLVEEGVVEDGCVVGAAESVLGLVVVGGESRHDGGVVDSGAAAG